jgi:murein DD-endopeptidase MepM/ murein hydrolase activator NlpD
MRAIINKKSVCLLFLFITVQLCSILLFSGCSTVPQKESSVSSPLSVGEYHKIRKGQTLWQIARYYAIPLDELVKVNNIAAGEMIKEGQVLFIPRPAVSIVNSDPKASSQTIVNAGTAEDFCWPLKGKVISTYGKYYRGMLNKGVNIQAQKYAPIVAARAGKVVFCSADFYGLGKMLILSHGDGLSTVYGRNSEILIKKGDYVRKGALIARVGAAGRDKTVYLHFEVRKGHVAQNPYFYLPD